MKHIRLWSILVALVTFSIHEPLLAADAAVATTQNRIENLLVAKAGEGTVLKIEFQQALSATPSHFSIANPARLVFDLPNMGNGLGYTTKAVNEGGLRSMNVVQAGDRTRLVLNLEKAMRFETRQDGKSLLIQLADVKSASMDGAVSPQHFAGAEGQDGQSIRDIQFRRSKDGAGVVVVDLSASNTGIDVQQKGTKLLLSFKGTRLPDNLRKRLDVVDFATPVMEVSTKAVGQDVSMEIVPKGLWEHVAFQSDNQFIVEVRPVKEDPNKLFQGTRTGFQGEAISLNFQNIPLRELLHVFADITNFNIVVSDSVAGNVSLRLNDVPWDHALEIVLQQKNLAMRKSGNVLWIAPRDELAARDKLLAEARDAAEVAETPRLEVFQLNYQTAEDFVGMLKSGKAAADSKNKDGGFLSALGKVSIDKRTNQAFIYDIPTKLELIRGLLAKIDRPARQVLIEARIVEASDNFANSLGARLGIHQGNVGATQENKNLRFVIGGGLADTGAHTGQIEATPDFFRDATGSNFPAANVGASLGVTNSQPGAFSLILFNNAMSRFLNLEISALEADKKGKIISSPRVMTADQVEALIEQGTEVPYLSASSSGATSVSYKKAVLSLKVKPQITPEGSIVMSLEVNKDAPSQLYSTSYGIALDTKHIKTDVLVDNGGTVVIGGIYTQNESETNARVPLLGDLPFVGFFFRNKERQNIRTELLIFITPKIVSDIQTGH
jgi:type IV pilus assembly protein PilQ